MSFRPAPFRVPQTRCYGASRSALPMAVVPAHAGIHFRGAPKDSHDSRPSGNDGVMKVLALVEGCK
jgi:hypothetical protein